MLTDSTRTSPTASLGAQDRMIAGLTALILGVFLIYGAGLANADVLHNAAHDTRHAFGFPCH